jgi:Fe2+ transport system protein FeoA
VRVLSDSSTAYVRCPDGRALLPRLDTVEGFSELPLIRIRAIIRVRSTVDSLEVPVTTPRDQLLTAAAVGERTSIEAVTSALVQHRLELLGIGVDETLVVEHRGDYGDLIVAVGTRSVHLPEHLARHIRVRRGGAPATVAAARSVTDLHVRPRAARLRRSR